MHVNRNTNSPIRDVSHPVDLFAGMRGNMERFPHFATPFMSLLPELQDAVLSGPCVTQQGPFGHLHASNDKKIRVFTFLQHVGRATSHRTSSSDGTADPMRNFSIIDVRMRRPENTAF